MADDPVNRPGTTAHNRWTTELLSAPESPSWRHTNSRHIFCASFETLLADTGTHLPRANWRNMADGLNSIAAYYCRS